jgi:hypothetical protein
MKHKNVLFLITLHFYSKHLKTFYFNKITLLHETFKNVLFLITLHFYRKHFKRFIFNNITLLHETFKNNTFPKFVSISQEILHGSDHSRADKSVWSTLHWGRSKQRSTAVNPLHVFESPELLCHSKLLCSARIENLRQPYMQINLESREGVAFLSYLVQLNVRKSEGLIGLLNFVFYRVTVSCHLWLRKCVKLMKTCQQFAVNILLGKCIAKFFCGDGATSIIFTIFTDQHLFIIAYLVKNFSAFYAAREISVVLINSRLLILFLNN